MKVLAIVPARGGSKRLPGKNIRLLGGIPLIVWSINAAKDVPEICDILASTDDPAIAEVARHAGALVPWLRPRELASDTASSAEVCLHAVDWYEQENGKVDALLLLQPTSPFRSRATVLRGIELFRKHLHRPVIGIYPAEPHPMWCFRLEGETMRHFIEGVDMPLRSQDLPAAYHASGSFYLISPEDLRMHRTFYCNSMVPLLIDDPKENIDIDTQWDWDMAEAVMRSYSPGGLEQAP